LLDVVVIGLVRRRVDAIDGTNLDARVVLLANARLGDDVGHFEGSPKARFPGARRGPRPSASGHFRDDATVLLLTGATGSVGSRLLPLLLERGEEVRCLVREPRKLGPRRVDVQIALGDPGEMSDPYPA